MKKRFIILIDFSPYSANLLRYAYDWSKKVDAAFILVHNTIVAAPALADTESRREIASITNREVYEKLQNFAQSLLPEKTQVRYFVSERNLVLSLPELLQEPFENLIFLGIKGTGILKKIFIGSVAVQVIDHVNNVIVAVPKNIESFSSKTIHVAVSKNYPINTVEFNKFLRFTGNNIEKIAFFSLVKPDDDLQATEKYLKELKDLYSDQKDTTYELYQGRHIFQDLKKVINHKADELLVVQRGSRVFSDQIFRKFFINELVYEGEIPLIILP